MTAYNKMPFPPHQGIPFDYAPPKVDGFMEPDPGVSTTQLDPGYTGGGRFAFGGASGVPMVVFQGVKHNAQDLIYMGFVARYDPGFDGKDFVSVFLQPSPGAPSAADRRIDVHPNLPLVVPNPPPAQTTSAGALAAPADPDGNDRIGMGFPEIRTNKPPNAMTVYKRTPGGPDKWALMAQPAGLDCKVRSEFDGVSRFWTVELQIPSTNVGDWITLGSTFGLYFNVGVAWTDAATAITYVSQYPWPYDPDVSGMGSFLADPAGFSITPENWDPPLYGSGLLGTTTGADGVRFLNDAYGIGVLDAMSNVGGSADLTAGATNKMVARLQNTSANTAKKVRARFRIAEFGISGGLYSGGALWEDIGTPAQNPAPNAGVDIPTTPGATYHDIELDWLVTGPDHTKFHTLSADQCLWVQLDTIAPAASPPGAAVQFVESSMRRNLWFTHLSTVQHKAVLDASHLDLEHLIENTHDLFLQVASTPVKAVAQTPVEKALLAADVKYESFRPMLARAPLAAPISRVNIAAGDRAAAGSAITSLMNENPILAATIARGPVTTKIPQKTPPAKIATWFTAVNGYQVLGNRTLTFAKGEKARIVAYVGSYGYVAQHVVGLGESIDKLALSHQLAGPTLKSVGNNMYRGTVAPKAKIQLVNTLKTVPISKLPAPLVRPVAIVAKPFIAIANMIRKPGA
jgi:hypothetical protein